MSTVTAKPTTAQEFLEFVQRPENRDKWFELERGEIIEMPPPNKHHGFVCGNISRILGVFAMNRGKGYVCGNDTGVLVEEDPDTVRGPNILFFEDEAEGGHLEEVYAVTPPKLAIDVLSPHDRMSRVVVRVTQLLNRGVPLVWIVDPQAGDVFVYRAGRDPCVVSGDDDLTGDDVLPDFRCKASDLFAVPGALRKEGT